MRPSIMDDIDPKELTKNSKKPVTFTKKKY